MPHRRPPRLRNFDYIGSHRYFVTCSTAERRKAFEEAEAVDCVRSQILRTCGERSFAELTAVFMPDHLHLLLQGQSAASAFLPFMKVMRQRTAMFYRRLAGYSLWQDGYFERVLRPDDDIPSIVEYMMENPVRAGLVGRPEDYPFAYRQKTETEERGTLVPRQ